MAGKDKEQTKDEIETVGGIPIRGTADEFGPEEMLTCPKCGRSTPPNRLDCFYCGADFDRAGAQSKKLKPVLRPPGADESGFDLVLMPGGSAPTEKSLRITRTITRLEEDELQRLFGVSSAVPIARSDSRKAIEIAMERLAEAGIATKIFADEQFQPSGIPRRIRRLTPEDGGGVALTMFNDGDVKRYTPQEILLVVTGRVTIRSIESKEKHKGKGKQKVVATTESADDEAVIDMYLGDSMLPFRIQAAGFDFSFLGKEMDLLAGANLQKTAGFIREFAVSATFDDTYNSVRPLLDRIWPPEERGDTRGIKRRAFGSFERDRMVTTSGIGQFTKYSQLQWLIREKRAPGL